MATMRAEIAQRFESDFLSDVDLVFADKKTCGHDNGIYQTTHAANV